MWNIRKKLSNTKGRVDKLLFTEDHHFELPETRWAARLTSVNPHVTNTVVVIGSLVGGALLSSQEWGWASLIAVVILVGIALDHFRDSREETIVKEREAIQQQAIKDLVHTIVDTSQGTCDALTLEEKRSRDNNLAAARRAILSTVRRTIGPDTGVRVNFFEVKKVNPPSLEASTYGHEGRQNHRSATIFTLADESFRLALHYNQGRFVEDAYAEKITPAPSYQTFATMPVSSDNVFYGLLTVDSPHTGDITEFEAKELLNLWASQLALTFANSKGEKCLKIGDTGDVIPTPDTESHKMEVATTLGKDNQDEP